jgi:hypothetical protein
MTARFFEIKKCLCWRKKIVSPLLIRWSRDQKRSFGEANLARPTSHTKATLGWLSLWPMKLWMGIKENDYLADTYLPYNSFH